MAIDRKLIDYLPPFMQVYREIATIMETEQPEIDLLWNSADDAFADQYILEATVNGVSRWEFMLGISPKGTDTLDERKFRILARLNQELPYTLRKLMQVLTNLCGEDGYSVEVNAAEYHVEVKLALSNESNYSEVESILKKMLPANLTSAIKIKYNSHKVLNQMSHAELAAFTHDDLRKEVFE
jgi:hypothetical protein